MKNTSQDNRPKKFIRLRKMVRTNWWLFAASRDSPRSVLISRIILVLTPLITGIGFGIALSHVIPILPAIILGGFVVFMVGRVMLATPPQAKEQVSRYLEEDTLIETDKEYLPSPALIEDTVVRPVFYQGVGEWMASGHQPIKEFIQTIQSLDQFVDAIDYRALEELVEYSYAINTYSPRRKMPALKITDHTEPNSFAITRLKAPYDNYVTDPSRLSSAPPSPALPTPMFDIPEDNN